ncbi:MAG: MmgE/PrpD family protein [Paracoccaceae bacterium]
MENSKMQSPDESGWALQLGGLLADIGRGPLPAAAADAAKARLVHAFGVSLANSRLPAAQNAWRALGGAPKGGAFVFGRDTRLHTEDAAFINGVIGHGSLLEDCGPGGLREGSHPGTFIIPAALAVAEETGVTGARFLAGVVTGYEAVSRIGAAGPASIVQRRFRPLGVMGAFGAASAAAAIMGADDEQMAAAIAIAANLAGGTTQGIFEGSMEPYFQAAFGARNGILAARLAMAGALPSREALEGEYGFFQTYGGEPGDLAIMIAPRAVHGIASVGMKRFAACLQNQATVAAIVDGLSAPLDAAQIDQVVIRRPATGTNGLNSPGVSRSKPFANMLAAQMSARFTAAAALLGKPVDDPGFFARAHADAEIVALTDRIMLEPVDEGVSVEVMLKDGGKLMLDHTDPNLLFPSDDMIAARFLRRTAPIIGKQPAAQLLATLLRLEDAPSLRPLTDAMTVAEI